MNPLATLEKKVLRKTGRAIRDFEMIRAGDRVLVALSGGKDSWALLRALTLLRARAPIDFDVVGVTVHPGFASFDPAPLERYCREEGIPHFTERTSMDEIIEAHKSPDTTYCSFCSRLRRGVLYSIARREGFTKVALGHHADDLVETLLMAQFFTGEIKSMPPVLAADDGVNTIIRPLCYLFEETIGRYAALAGFPVIHCGCPVRTDDSLKRKRTKELLTALEAEHPGIKANLLSALGRVRPRYLMPGAIRQ